MGLEWQLTVRENLLLYGRLAVIHQGKLLAVGTAAELKTRVAG